MPIGATHSRSREEGERRRAEILDHAQRIIGMRGYNGFSIQELAESCGLSKPGVLHHFGTKEQLLIALLRDRDRAHEAAIVAGLGIRKLPSASRRERRDHFISGIKAVLVRDIAEPELTRLHASLRVEALDRDHPAHDYFEKRSAEKQETLAVGLADLVPNPRSVARQVLALMAGLTEQWFREEGAFDLLDEFDAVIQLILPESRK